MKKCFRLPICKPSIEFINAGTAIFHKSRIAYILKQKFLLRVTSHFSVGVTKVLDPLWASSHVIGLLLARTTICMT
jgi:hypothetical protein